MLMKFFWWWGEGRSDVKLWTSDVEVHEFASYMKYSTPAMLRWCKNIIGEIHFTGWLNPSCLKFKLHNTDHFRRRVPGPYHAIVYQHCPITTASMKENFYAEAQNSSSRSKIYHTLWNPKVPYRVHKSSPPDPILIVTSPLHALQ
jgi:hypothetical protein